MKLYETLHDGESEATPAGTIPSVDDAIVTVEDALQMLRRHAGPIVQHLNPDVLSSGCRGHCDVTGGRKRRDGVGDQVADDLPKTFRVDARYKRRGRLNVDRRSVRPLAHTPQ